MTENKETRTEFINRVMGLPDEGIRGKISFCNDERRQVLFSIDLAHDNPDLILDLNWKNDRGFAAPLKDIAKVEHEGYELLVYKVRTVTKIKKGKHDTKVKEFDPSQKLEVRALRKNGAGQYFAVPLDITLAEEIVESEVSYVEGAKKQIVVNAYERDPKARKACIDAHGYFCSICGFDFEKKYGARGKGFIHVHHIVPLSKMGKTYKVDPVKDLIPVCPNCHAMLHRNGRTLSPEELVVKTRNN